MNSLSEKVFMQIRTIPRGRVTTYGELARIVGTHARLIGRVLHQNTQPDVFPCHRVIKSDGTIASGYAFGGPHIQQKLLESEGVTFKNSKVDLKIFGW